jgi:hypothetical protein
MGCHRGQLQQFGLRVVFDCLFVDEFIGICYDMYPKLDATMVQFKFDLKLGQNSIGIGRIGPAHVSHMVAACAGAPHTARPTLLRDSLWGHRWRFLVGPSYVFSRLVVHLAHPCYPQAAHRDCYAPREIFASYPRNIILL